MDKRLEIPQGTTKEDIQKRKQFIIDFYKDWIIANPCKKVFNKSLQQDIYVRFLSIEETSQHAAKRFSSTEAVTHLTTKCCEKGTKTLAITN